MDVPNRSAFRVNHCSDEELTARCAGGDRTAMDVLVGRYHAQLLDFAYRRLRDRDAAADIAQTALARAFQSAASYRPGASFRTWLYTIALNLVRDEWRRRRVRKESPLAETEPASDSHSPEDAAVDRMDASALWESVAALPEDRACAVVLKFRHGLTYEEIAEVMRAPVGTIKSWVHHGLRALRESLDSEEREDY